MTNPTPLDGLLLLNKPKGKTSHDFVNFLRRRFNLKKVGHCGTLDPMATGLLMLVIGKATKVQDLLVAEDKEYEGTLTLGSSTNTQDAEGEVESTHDVPDLDVTTIRKAFDQFLGDFYQTPPMVSALKKDGVPLYKLARQGKVVEREPRLMHVYRYDLGEIALPNIDFKIRCSKGFYVRTYCHDIGHSLECGGHLSRLVRTRSGNFHLSDAVSWEHLQEMGGLPELIPHVLSLPEISRIRRQ